jgi:hypothetical protein
MNITRVSVLLAFFLLVSGNTQALSDNEILNRFELVPDVPCVKAKIKEPKEVDTPYFSERHYLAIDNSKECQILDVWVAPLTNSLNENRRYMDSILYRRKGRAWIKEYGLNYVPKFRLRDKETGRIYFYIMLNEAPFYISEVVYFDGHWKDEATDDLFVRNINRIGMCSGQDKEQCIEQTRIVDRAIEIFKQR